MSTAATGVQGPSFLSRRTAVLVFLAFAFAYFFSALLRAITATLSPTLSQEFSLHARDLGLLAGDRHALVQERPAQRQWQALGQ